ncbi:MAG: hypothetical protein HUU55_22360 [Myxococcales bacterium]|nr:hypothetical protein [Myxococcales bacterium]
METEQSHQVWSKAYAQIHQSLDHADSMDAFDQAHTTCARIRTLIDRENPAGKNRLLADWNEQCQKGVRLRLAEWVILNVKESGHGRWCKIASERLQFLETTGRNDETTTDVAKRLHESCRNQHTLQQRDGDDDREDTAIRSQILRTGVSRNTE